MHNHPEGTGWLSSRPTRPTKSARCCTLAHIALCSFCSSRPGPGSRSPPWINRWCAIVIPSSDSGYRETCQRSSWDSSSCCSCSLRCLLGTVPFLCNTQTASSPTPSSISRSRFRSIFGLMVSFRRCSRAIKIYSYYWFYFGKVVVLVSVFCPSFCRKIWWTRSGRACPRRPLRGIFCWNRSFSLLFRWIFGVAIAPSN